MQTTAPLQLDLPKAECWYLDQFLSEEQSKEILQSLLMDIPWRQDQIFMFGREVAIPRLQCFMGDEGVHYTYSGLSLTAVAWHPLVKQLRDLLKSRFDQTFNAVLMNLYRDGNDSMGWHQDNEPELGKDPIIASISLGAERRFLLRNKKEQSEKRTLQLSSGSLLWMGEGVQQIWQHSLPKTKSCHTPRINLTFRQINPTN